MKYYLTVCAIARDEARYLDEWIAYHYLKGVEHFYICYDDNCDDTKLAIEILEKWKNKNIVTYKLHDTRNYQQRFYSELTQEKIMKEAKWLAFIDLDEFITPLGDLTLPEFLRRNHQAAGVELNWMMYGNSGHKKPGDGLVIENYKSHASLTSFVSRHVKTIANPRKIKHFLNVHHMSYTYDTKAIDANGNSVNTHFLDRPPVWGNFRINHYYTKSREEFFARKRRGPTPDRKTGFSEQYIKHLYDVLNLNEIENDPIMDKWISLLKS